MDVGPAAVSGGHRATVRHSASTGRLAAGSVRAAVRKSLHQLNYLTLLLLYVFHCAMRFKQTKQRYEFRFLTVSVQLHRHILFHPPQV